MLSHTSTYSQLYLAPLFGTILNIISQSNIHYNIHSQRYLVQQFLSHINKLLCDKYSRLTLIATEIMSCSFICDDLQEVDNVWMVKLTKDLDLTDGRYREAFLFILQAYFL